MGAARLPEYRKLQNGVPCEVRMGRRSTDLRPGVLLCYDYDLGLARVRVALSGESGRGHWDEFWTPLRRVRMGRRDT